MSYNNGAKEKVLDIVVYISSFSDNFIVIPSKVLYWREIVNLHKILQFRTKLPHKAVTVHHDSSADLSIRSKLSHLIINTDIEYEHLAQFIISKHKKMLWKPFMNNSSKRYIQDHVAVITDQVFQEHGNILYTSLWSH